MFNAEKTIYSKKIENRIKCGLPYTPLLNTTLNEKFNIYPGVDNANIPYPIINLITIGSGLSSVNNSSSRLKMDSSPHSATDAALFNHIPFYLRPTSEAMVYPPSPKLRLHKVILIDGIEYNVYYGYKITNYEYNDDIIKYTNIEDEYVNISKFDIVGSDILNPTPSTNINLDTKVYISDFIKIYTFFSEGELNEMINAFNILYPDTTPIITELGICTSKDIVIDGKDESVMVQVAYFIDLYKDLIEAKNNKKLDFFIEIGDMEVIAV